MRFNIKSALRGLTVVALAVIGSLTVASKPAHAYTDNYIFGFSSQGSGVQQLVINGSTVIDATNTGWYDSNGTTQFPSNSNYIVGDCQSCNVNYRDFFSFDLSAVTGPITSAYLRIYNPSSTATSGYLLLHDATAYATEILSGVSSTSTYNDLAAGAIVGGVIASTATSSTDLIVNINAFGRAALEALEGNSFIFSGEINAVAPLPAGLPMLVVGLLVVAAAVQFRKKQVTA